MTLRRLLSEAGSFGRDVEPYRIKTKNGAARYVVGHVSRDGLLGITQLYRSKRIGKYRSENVGVNYYELTYIPTGSLVARVKGKGVAERIAKMLKNLHVGAKGRDAVDIERFMRDNMSREDKDFIARHHVTGTEFFRIDHDNLVDAMQYISNVVEPKQIQKRSTRGSSLSSGPDVLFAKFYGVGDVWAIGFKTRDGLFAFFPMFRPPWRGKNAAGFVVHLPSKIILGEAKSKAVAGKFIKDLYALMDRVGVDPKNNSLFVHFYNKEVYGFISDLKRKHKISAYSKAAPYDYYDLRELGLKELRQMVRDGVVR